jgi:hypothetical protein
MPSINLFYFLHPPHLFLNGKVQIMSEPSPLSRYPWFECDQNDSFARQSQITWAKSNPSSIHRPRFVSGHPRTPMSHGRL